MYRFVCYREADNKPINMSTAIFPNNYTKQKGGKRIHQFNV